MNFNLSGIQKIIRWVLIVFFFIVAYPFATSHSILTPIAISTNSPSLCQKITNFSIGASEEDQTLGCYISVAVNFNDVSACNKIPASLGETGRALGKRHICYASVAVATRNPLICGDANNVNKDGCYMDYSRRMNDILACRNIQSIKDKIFCYEYFKNPSGDTCFEIKADTERLRCIRENACIGRQC